MLRFQEQFDDMPIRSLQTAKIVAYVVELIINPNNLEIVGFYCDYEGRELVLHRRDIREVGNLGVIIDHEDAFSELEDLVRIKQVVDLKFKLMNKPVLSKRGDKLGRVKNYAVDTDSLQVQKLYISPSLIRNLLQGQRVIDRSQILEVTSKRILVEDASVTEAVPQIEPAQADS